MTHLLRLSAALMCLAIGWCFYRLPDVADAAIAREGAATRAMVVVEALELRRMVREDLLPQVNFGLRVVDDRSQQALLIAQDLGERADKRIGEAVLAADVRLAAAIAVIDGRSGEAAAAVTGLRADLKPTLENAASIVHQTKEALPMFLDCVQWDEVTGDIIGSNPSCVFNRFQGTAKATEQAFQNVAAMSRDVRDALPKLTESAVGIGKSADGIAADVHTATSDFVKPRSTWQKVKSTLLDVGRIAARVM